MPVLEGQLVILAKSEIAKENLYRECDTQDGGFPRVSLLTTLPARSSFEFVILSHSKACPNICFFWI